MNVKLALSVAWFVGLMFYLVEVIQRVKGYVGFVPGATDAIAVLLLVGVAALIWNKKEQAG